MRKLFYTLVYSTAFLAIICIAIYCFSEKFDKSLIFLLGVSNVFMLILLTLFRRKIIPT